MINLILPVIFSSAPITIVQKFNATASRQIKLRLNERIKKKNRILVDSRRHGTFSCRTSFNSSCFTHSSPLRLLERSNFVSMSRITISKVNHIRRTITWNIIFYIDIFKNTVLCFITSTMFVVSVIDSHELDQIYKIWEPLAWVELTYVRPSHFHSDLPGLLLSLLTSPSSHRVVFKQA